MSEDAVGGYDAFAIAPGDPARRVRAAAEQWTFEGNSVVPADALAEVLDELARLRAASQS